MLNTKVPSQQTDQISFLFGFMIQEKNLKDQTELTGTVAFLYILCKSLNHFW